MLSVGRLAMQQQGSALLPLTNTLVPQPTSVYFTSQSFQSPTDYFLEVLDVATWQLTQSVLPLPSNTAAFAGFFVDESSRSLVCQVYLIFSSAFHL